MNYKNFKIDSNSLNRLAPELLKELELGAFQTLNLNDTDMVTVVTKDLSGNEKRQTITIEQAKAGLNNPRMNDTVIYSTEMKFEFNYKK
jgi:hypothetical protein